MRLDTETGAVLRGARESQGKTLEELARRTGTRADYLAAFEDGDIERVVASLGGAVYARHHLRGYAKALGIDPEPVLRSFERAHGGPVGETSGSLRRVPTGKVERGPAPPWVAWVIVAVGVLVGLSAIASLIGPRTPDAATPQPTVFPSAAESSTPTPTPTTTPTPTPTFSGVNLELAFTGPCWVRILVDGVIVEEGVRGDGESLSIQGEQLVSVRYGNPAAVMVTHNGRDLGVAGDGSSPTTVDYDLDGIAKAA